MSDATVFHVDYPHAPGMLYGCWACESQCHCEDGFTCIHCGPEDEEE